MKIGQKFILLRYSNHIVPDTIDRHIKKLEESGYCWFGKIGAVPSVKIRNAVMDEDNPHIILYTKGVAYECDLLDITETKPETGYPEYYDEKFIIPSVYFKLGSISEINPGELSRYRIICSGRALDDAIWHSMTSYFFAEWYDGTKADTGTVENKSNKIKSEKDLLPKNDCRYRSDVLCGCRSCVSYGYECERPEMCLKQKR